MTVPKLMVVDDEPTIRHSFRKVFADAATRVVVAGSLAEARRVYDAERPDVLLLDLQLPDGSGLAFFEEVRRRDPKRPVIFVTAQGTAATAIEAMKRGAFDYLTKPVDLDRLQALLPQAFEAARLMAVPAELPSDPTPDHILGRSPAVQDLCKAIGRLAARNVTVLIQGESGTGKELVARALYHHGDRAAKPFLAINCAALPEGLVESELFGHESGAFTGALRRRAGRFEQCDGGTLLLDEVGDMPLAVQAKMLRLLQEQRFERVGGGEPVATDVRVLAATNRDLGRLVAEGKFRGDLYFRLQAVTVRVPPLRERRGDVPELAHHFLFAAARDLDRDARGFTPEALDRLQAYDWPGNVRELRGVVEHAILSTGGPTIGVESLRLGPATAATALNAVHDLAGRIEALLAAGAGNAHAEVLAEVERELLTRALRHTRGHQARASDLLGINRTTLRTKLRDLGLTLDKVVEDRPAGEGLPAPGKD